MLGGMHGGPGKQYIQAKRLRNQNQSVTNKQTTKHLDWYRHKQAQNMSKTTNPLIREQQGREKEREGGV